MDVIWNTRQESDSNRCLLQPHEFSRLVATCPDDPRQRELARANCTSAGTRAVSVAEVYRACERASAELRRRQS
jgi:hypothetical protein